METTKYPEARIDTNRGQFGIDRLLLLMVAIFFFLRRTPPTKSQPDKSQSSGIYQTMEPLSWQQV